MRQKFAMQKKIQLGFSLLELMVVLAIIAILAAIAVPSYTTFITNNRLLSTTNDLMGVIRLARSEALKRGTSVSFCPSANGSSCTNSNQLNSGWVIFIDSSTPGVVDDSALAVDGGDIIVYRDKDNSISTKASFPVGTTYLRYSSQGYLTN